jgi:FtsZ-interacting cell division protein ZipA
MSDLQISLLIIGAAVICGVYLFNWQQERKFRRRLTEAFEREHEDVLLASGRDAEGRAEPQLEREPIVPAPAAKASRAEAIPLSPPVPPGTEIDDAIDCVAAVDSDAPLPEAVIGELLSRVATCGKPYHAAGLNAETGKWEDLTRAAGGRYTALRLALQLANRAGPVSGAQIAMFCDAVRGCAEKTGAVASCPDTHAALQAAQELDALCAEVDIAIGVNVIAMDGRSFAGAKIRAVAEVSGFKLEPDGVFRWRNEQRQTLFTLDNHEPAPFLPEQITGLSTSGITLLLDVPRVGDGLNVLDRMLDIGRDLAQALGGSLVDDNRVPLNEAGIGRIRQQLARIYATMQAHGVEAGGARALRLFS